MAKIVQTKIEQAGVAKLRPGQTLIVPCDRLEQSRFRVALADFKRRTRRQFQTTNALWVVRTK